MKTLDDTWTIEIDQHLDVSEPRFPSRAENLPDVFCHRCQTWHPVSTQEDYDEMMAAHVKTVTDAIDAEIVRGLHANIV